MFDGPQAAVHVLWNHNFNRWAFIAGAKADGSRQGGGDLEWFGSEITEAIYPQGVREGGLPSRTYDRDTRQIDMTGGAVLRVERASYREVPDVHYTIGVYDGTVGPVQLMKGVAATSAADLNSESVQSCSGRPAVADVNRDGYRDFWLCDAQGANGFQSGAYRLFDPEAGLFVKDLRFSFRGLHVFDPRTRTIREGQSATAGQYQTHNTYDLSSGLPVLVEQRVQEPEDERCGWGAGCRMRVYTRAWEGHNVRVTEARLGSGADYTLPLDFGAALPPASHGNTLAGLPSDRRPISPSLSIYAYIRQGDRVFPLAPHPEFPASISLADGPFTIEVPGVAPDRGVAVCATSTDRTWELEVGGQVQAHPCFGIGSGMAIGPVRGRYAFPLVVVDGEGFSPFVPDRRRPNGTTALIEIDRIEFRDGDAGGNVHLIVLAGEASTLRAGDAWTAVLRRD